MTEGTCPLDTIAGVGGSSGTGALFIHGTASSGRIWAKVLGTGTFSGALQSGCVRSASGSVSHESPLSGPILTPDTPGMGDVQMPLALTLSFSYWLDHFRLLAGNRRLHLVGHSLGGAIAIHLAKEPWVESVTLIAPATRAYCVARRRDAPPGANPGSVVLPSPLGRLVSDPRSLSRDEARVLREDYEKASALLAAGVPWPPFPISESVYLRGKRVLLVYGEDDAIVPAGYFAKMREELESAAIEVHTLVLPGCGHLPQIERPIEVAEALAGMWISAFG